MDPAKPLPDEFCRGHSKRVLALNRQFRNATQLLQFVQAWRQCAAEKGRPYHVLEAIADACGIDRTQYLRLHSMLPFMSFCGSKISLRERTETWPGRQVVSAGTLSPRAAAYLCPSCVEEDKSLWYISYWRRTHQLPAAHTCSKHPDEPLRAVVHDSPFAHAPAHWLDMGEAVALPSVDDWRSHPMVKRFVEICEAMLDGGRCWNEQRVRKPLWQMARVLGIDTSQKRNLTKLSDLAFKKLPSPFIAELFPSHQRKRFGKIFRPMDAALFPNWPHTTPSSMALAMVLLYGSNEEALAAWRHAGVLVGSTTELARAVST